MKTKQITPDEERAYAELARAAARLRKAQDRANVTRLEKTSESKPVNQKGAKHDKP